ncbi:MAG: cob(I)yrinic acid a,c-diamide adenosyltransferase [Elusimicrobia bacterium]|nr:cob(I)yrinic acid a,c-diamide adenosyltransferase [Elusimicrobiota bacterium]
MKIYTKTGDKGETGLRGGSRLPKSDPRVQAYGDVDELNAALGLVPVSVPRRRAFSKLRLDLERVQGQLFELGAALSSPAGTAEAAAFRAGSELWLEAEIDRMTADLPPLSHFILPGGSQAGAALHLARTVCRRAERAAVALGKDAPPQSVVYLNRLSDFLFVCARWANNRLRSPEARWRTP